MATRDIYNKVCEAVVETCYAFWNGIAWFGVFLLYTLVGCLDLFGCKREFIPDTRCKRIGGYWRVTLFGVVFYINRPK